MSRRAIRTGQIQRLTTPDCAAGRAEVAGRAGPEWAASRLGLAGQAGVACQDGVFCKVGMDDQAGVTCCAAGRMGVADRATVQACVAGLTCLFTPGGWWQIVKLAHGCPCTMDLSGEQHWRKSLLPCASPKIDKKSMLRQC